MSKTDQRVLRTRQLLRDALIKLALEAGYDAVTITQITKFANVSYSTFFRHFKSKDDLLVHVLQASAEEILGMQTSDMTYYEEALTVYRHIQENTDSFLFFASLPLNHRSLRAIHDFLTGTVYNHFIAHDESRIPMEVIANHVATSMLALIRWWLNSEMKYSPEQMATIHCELIIHSTVLVAADLRFRHDSRDAAD